MSLIYNGNVTDTVIYNGQPTTGVYNGVIVWGESQPASNWDSYIVEIVPVGQWNCAIDQLDVNGTGISSSNTYKLERYIDGGWVDEQNNLNNLWSGTMTYIGSADALRIYFWRSSLQSGDNIRIKIPAWGVDISVTTKAIEYDSVNQIEGSTIKQQSATLRQGSNTTILTMP